MNEDIVMDERAKKDLFTKLDCDGGKILDFLNLWAKNINEGKLGEGTPTMSRPKFTNLVSFPMIL